MGVTSFIDEIVKPAVCKALIAASLPEPGPFTKTSIFLIPKSYASLPAASAETCAANGVFFLDPLKLISIFKKTLID